MNEVLLQRSSCTLSHTHTRAPLTPVHTHTKLTERYPIRFGVRMYWMIWRGEASLSHFQSNNW